MSDMPKTVSFGIVNGHPNVTVTMHNDSMDRERIAQSRPNAKDEQLKRAGENFARQRLIRGGASETRFFPREVA